ncbi:hypothetical protein H2O64_13700 [Kordia sp. YSTF-M3]|uniref:DUF1616 domain-containing protein n=1 Tax=Kordia aestuariivivens TaxID=2759037 RepID=A0ABR7QAX4_9FLAO|nr:hypothetical protein [Kordia aestuariivivens]MBC8755725.1 hypothetical protein [Kordia aestuariivivens]
MKTILKKSKTLNFVIACIATVLLIVLVPPVAGMFFPEEGSFISILLPILSGFTTTIITSYHRSFSYGFAVCNSLAVFLLFCVIIILTVPIFGIILLIPPGIALVVFGSAVGYETREYQIKKIEALNQ